MGIMGAGGEKLNKSLLRYKQKEELSGSKNHGKVPGKKKEWI